MAKLTLFHSSIRLTYFYGKVDEQYLPISVVISIEIYTMPAKYCAFQQSRNSGALIRRHLITNASWRPLSAYSISVEPPFANFLSAHETEAKPSPSLVLQTPAAMQRQGIQLTEHGSGFGNSRREAGNINQRSHLNAIKWHFPLPPARKHNDAAGSSPSSGLGWMSRWLRGCLLWICKVLQQTMAGAH